MARAQVRTSAPGRRESRKVFSGFGSQEASQAYGQEEAPQAAEEGTHPTSPPGQVARAVGRGSRVGRVVLVTGVSRALGGHFARRIAAEPSVDRVIGVDVVPPRQNLAGLGNAGRPGGPGDSGGPGEPSDIAFVRADIRNPVIAKVIAG